MVKYTITVCNYNMGDTIGDALRSILEQVDDRFEVLVVDDGSTDDSVEVVKSLMESYERLRLHELPRDPNRNLGETRNISVREAKGDYVLPQIDADDYYEGGIECFVEIYHQFEEEFDYPFFFKGESLEIAPRDFLLEYGPYRDLPVGAEDPDLWARLLADDNLVWLSHEPVAHELGEGKSLEGKIRRGIRVRFGEFQTGMSLTSLLRWNVDQYRAGERSLPELFFDFVASPLCYLGARSREKYEPVEGFTEKGNLQRRIDEVAGTLPELEDRYGVTVDQAVLDEECLRVFYPNSSP